MSDEELDSVLEPSDPETQFIPQEDDHETLWEVIEITGEKGKRYKVRWKGNDPKTGKPWAQSWVEKHDCTDDLVRDWKLRQAKKKKRGSKRESGISKKPRTSTATAKSSTSAKRTATPLKMDSVDSTRRSTSTTTAVNARRSRSKASPAVHKTDTRLREPVVTYSPSPLSYRPTPSRSPADMSPTRSTERLPSVDPNTAPSTHKAGTKRKHAETTSAITSARIPASSTLLTAAAEEARTNHISGSIPPPRKRRKLEVELVSNRERSMQSTHAEGDDGGRKRKSRSRVVLSDDDGSDATNEVMHSMSQLEDPSQVETEEEEEADVRMVEESLSDIYCSPRPSSPLQPNHSQEDEGTPTPPVCSAHRQEDTVEDTPTVPRPQREKEKRIDSSPADLVRTSKPDPPSRASTRPSTSASSSTAIVNPTISDAITESHTTTTKHRILAPPAKSKSKTTTGTNKRKKAHPSTVSNQQWEELMDFLSQPVTESEVVPAHEKHERGISEEDPDLNDMYLDEPAVEVLPPLPPSPKSVPDQASSSRTGSAARSLTRLSTKPTPLRHSDGPASSAPSSPIIVPTTPPRHVEDDAIGAEDHKSPILSPSALRRLHRFDKVMMGIELKSGKGKEKEQQLEDGAILRKVNKGKEKEREKETVLAGGSGEQEHGLVQPSQEKRRKGKEKEQITEDREQSASTPKPPDTEKKKKAEPLFLPGESDIGEVPVAPVRSTRKGKSKSKETSQPPNPVLRSYESESDAPSLVRLKHEEREKAKAKRKEARAKEREQSEQRLPSHHPSDSGVEASVKSDAGSKRLKPKAAPRHKPATRSRSRLAETEEEAEEKEDNSSATNPKPTDREIRDTTSKPISKTTSKPQSETQPKPPSTVRRSANPRSNSFVDDIIPETEESQSQSQEVRADLQAQTTPHIPVPPATPASVNTKPTLRSRMKLKTPQASSKPLSRTSSAVGALALGLRLDMDIGMGNGIDERLEGDDSDIDEAVKKSTSKKANETGATSKPLGPIRKISPSVFKAHLPSSSLPESIDTEGDGDDSLKRAKDQNEDDDSIEQFESPVKAIGSGLGGERRIGILNPASRQEREKQRAKESVSDVWNSDLNRRGQELAEAARKKEKERLRAEETSALSASTSTKAAPQAKSALSGQLVTEVIDRLPDLQEEVTNPDVSMQSLPPDVILPPKDANSVVQQMEDAYVDLSGGAGEDQIAAPAAGAAASTSAIAGVEGSQSAEFELVVDSNDVDMDAGMGTSIVEQPLDPTRQKDDASTHDLSMVLGEQQGIEAEQSGDPVAGIRDDIADLPVIQIDSEPIAEAVLDEDAQKLHADNDQSDPSMDEIPSILVERPSRAPSTRSYSSLEYGNGARRKPTSRSSKSRSRSRSLSSQKSKNEKEVDPDSEIPPTASTHRESLQASSQPTDSQTESVEGPHHLGAAMHLLNTKSEEISKLEGQLSVAQRMNEDLLRQLSALRPHPIESTHTAQLVTKTLEQELAEAQAQLALQGASWENERAALVLDIEKATRGKASAEQDRDFFREQYAKASAFVSSVRDENVELEKRIKIATDQAQSGVSLIKATFELRTKSLEEDVRAWRRMAEFLMEKDRRTNDDIRKRAAEEPELRARCDRQESALEEIGEQLDQLMVEVEEKQRERFEAEEVVKRWKETTVKLNLELNEAKTKLERIGKIGIGDGDESAHSNSHEFVYRCQWRPDDSNDACEAVFLNISELQEHLYTGGHLQPD